LRSELQGKPSDRKPTATIVSTDGIKPAFTTAATIVSTDGIIGVYLHLPHRRESLRSKRIVPRHGVRAGGD
jgi:hypothetical protein